ncbi:hypothetical protein [Pedobacter heparinus]|uniref:Uncharacterized protein n=1 Tax=Pedobacter heparinus (strain ATCC 13125 / DSM 2366 / CIP 104194 / JCM 7457 / NBRC 12017 / NCIMB 9290 / NRRL B-14731 / HIM 762-3) TaxID=485917 RepID=C6XYP3_PEDHD|nr:hypothetical protein [Pedobacter heparinus]ACU04525.1 hypothetical protein Phep_2321 [Pedobacter heparinus DSM 2366]
MTDKPSFWQRIGIQDWFLSNNTTKPVAKVQALTPDTVYKYIIDKFKASIAELSFAERIVFYHEYIICLNTDDYRAFMDNKNGLLGLIAQESVKMFYEILNEYAAVGKRVEPSSNKWVFRFVSHPDYKQGDKGFIGKLMPDGGQKQENLRVTFIPRQTGLAQTFDISNEILKDFIFYSEGYYEIPYLANLKFDTKYEATEGNTILARFETTLPDKAYSGQKLEYLMKFNEITVSGNEEAKDDKDIFKIPSEWVNAPHLKIRFSKTEEKFYLSSFGEKTILNENLVERSRQDDPQWTELPLNSRIILNGIIGVNIFKA